nr:immunoglobulin light chain junction region [Mus musculus]NSL97696.1 immunoglobulin light chain junction region [Mus musculus]NSL97784.1 immunoglobulin light chain junction region [Mus musculus]NSL98341.1 immunoglobulin light chain junction region [Mus musculus]NSL98984.1 immunoglobulin light chain junction region [Mus musculus]
CQQSRKVPLTF